LSKDFKENIKDFSEYTLINPRKLKFVSLKGLLLEIKPAMSNSGIKYKVFLAAKDT
jgi:hypothetical protein